MQPTVDVVEQAPPPPPMLPILNPAPVQRSHNRIVWVYVWGLVSTFLTLVLTIVLHAVMHHDLMGIYVARLFPVGAVFIGLLASSGYLLSARRLGIRIDPPTTAVLVLLQICAYFGISWLLFKLQGRMYVKTTGRTVGFLEYYHVMTVTRYWPGMRVVPMGLTGYVFRAAEVFGFSLAVLIVPAKLRERRYCELCERYMEKKRIALMHASKSEALQVGIIGPCPWETLTEGGLFEIRKFLSNVHARNWQAAQKLAATFPRRNPGAQWSKFELMMHHCKACHDGVFESVFVNPRQSKKFRRFTFDERHASPDFIRQFAPSVAKTVRVQKQVKGASVKPLNIVAPLPGAMPTTVSVTPPAAPSE